MKSAFKNLNGNHHRTDIGLLLAVLVCSCISSLLLYSITANGVLEKVDASYYKTQIFSTVVGLILAVVISLFDYKKFVRLWFLYAPVALFLSMLVFTSLGYQREGADDRAWLDLGFIKFQPSEILKFAFILTFSYHVSKDEENSFL